MDGESLGASGKPQGDSGPSPMRERRVAENDAVMSAARTTSVAGTVRSHREAMLVLVQERGAIVDAGLATTRRSGSHYEAAERDWVRGRLEVLYDRLLEAVSTRDLSSVVDYARELALRRFQSGYDLSEIQGAVNALEEATWTVLLAHLQPDDLAFSLGLVSTVFGAAKDVIAREYVSLASTARIPSVDLRALASGDAGA